MNNQTTNGRIAQAIKKARVEAGLTQVQLAERVASIKDATVVSKIESGSRTVTPAMLNEIMGAMGYKVTIRYTKIYDDDSQRHGELVDKKFLTGLTSEEVSELNKINQTLDKSEEEYYDSIKRDIADIASKL